MRTLESADDIGAVGGKLVFSDGRLKEAGGMILSDGSYKSYGAGDDPQSPEYMYMRDVAYCSETFLLTRRKLFLSLASSKDADYGARLRTAGKRVVYDPSVVVCRISVCKS